MSWLQNLFANLTPVKILKGLACVISSLSLTGYIDLYTLNSVWSRLLVFCCCILVWGLLWWIINRLSEAVLSLKTVLLAIAAAFLIMIGYRDLFFSSTQETFISLTSETAGEICLCDVVVDGENIPIFQTEVVENNGWLYGEQYDNFRIWPKEDGVENRLTMRFLAKEVHLGFPYTPYAGSVTITSSTGSSETWDLRCPEWEEGEAVKYADFPIDCRHVYTPLGYLLYGIGFLVTLSGLCLLMLLAWMKFRLRLNWLSEKSQGSDWRNVSRKGHQNQRPLPGKNRWSLQPFFDKIHRSLQPLFDKVRQSLQPLFDKVHRNLQLLLSKNFLNWGSCFSPLDIGLRLISFVNLLIGYHLLFFSSTQITPDRSTAIFLALFTAASCLCLFSPLLEKYKTRRSVVFVAIISLYASFASFGQRFFLDGNTRIHFSADGMFYIVLGMIWFIPIIYLLLFFLELLASHCRPRTGLAHRLWAFWGFLTILCLCQAVILWKFWPGGFPADCIDLMMQATGHVISNWHPVLNVILYRIILTICPHAGALVAVQMFFFALLCTKFLMLGYDHGVSFKILVVLGAVVSLLPNQVIFSISPLKDYPYTLALLWTTYLLVRLILDPNELWKWRFLVALSLSLFLIYGFRHNGIVPFAVLLLLFGGITLRYFSRVKLKLVEVGLAAVLLVAAYKGPVFSLLHVSQDLAMSRYTTMLCAVASCINKGLPLSEESTAIMESILPLDQWGTYYDRYAGHDPYYWGRGEENETAYPFDPSRVTAKEAFTVYLEALRKYPDVVIKDRLDGTDLLWDVRQPTDGFNIKGFYGIVISETDDIGKYFDFSPMEPGVHYYNQSRLAEFYRSKMPTPGNSVLDMLLWRSGAYLILLMTLSLFWWKNQMKIFFWAAMPLLGQIAGLILVLYHQSYRYISAVQSLTLALVFCSVCLRNTLTASVNGGAEHG